MSRFARQVRRRLKALEAVAHAPVTPMVSAKEFDILQRRVDRAEVAIHAYVERPK